MIYVIYVLLFAIGFYIGYELSESKNQRRIIDLDRDRQFWQDRAVFLTKRHEPPSAPATDKR